MIAEVKIMNKFLEQALLYDFYGELLTEHQKDVYEQVWKIIRSVRSHR